MEKTIQQPKEHILVCLSSAPSNENIIRTGAKMAQAFGGSFTALYVKTPSADRMGAANEKRLKSHIQLAEILGAEIATVTGEEVAYQIAEFARLSKVTKVVMGRSIPKGTGIFRKKPLTEQLIDLAPSLEIYIIPDTAGDNARQHPRPEISGKLPTAVQWGISLGILAASTLIGQLFHSFHFTEANTITIYILGALLTALFTRNNWCSTAFSLASVILFNFFFTEPRLSLRAYESGYPVTFAIMLTASIITGTLANRLSDHAKQSAQSAYRAKVLFETNQLLQQAEEDAILSTTARQLEKLLNREAAVLTSIYEHTPGWKALPIESGNVVHGILDIHIGDSPLDHFENSILLSVLGECTLAMESRRNAREKEESAVMAKNEQLRANLLRAISHDLRTPLTSISGNAENLMLNRTVLEEDAQTGILKDIYEDSLWLIQLVENLLAITRIGEGKTRLNITAQLVEEVVDEALSHIRKRNKAHILKTQMPNELLLAKMDARLISQVIINLVDNALKYTPSGSEITISAERAEDFVSIQVADNGPGIPNRQKKKVFDMFYAGSTKVADCRRSLGLGLSLCKSIVEAHGGEIRLFDNDPSGCVFTFTLPISEVTPYE